MKKALFILVAVVFSMLIAQTMSAQPATATQTVTFQVNAVYKISTSGDPNPLTISDGVAGTDNLNSVSDNSTTYSITQNFANTVKITANLDAALPAGYTLLVNLASSKGSSAGAVNISSATPGSALNVVTAINRGADAGRTIEYTFGATAAAGPLASTTRDVTLTLTN